MCEGGPLLSHAFKHVDMITQPHTAEKKKKTFKRAPAGSRGQRAGAVAPPSVEESGSQTRTLKERLGASVQQAPADVRQTVH